MASEPFLGVQKSYRGRVWRSRVPATDDLIDYVRASGLDEFTSRLLIGRGVEAENARDFLDPKIRTYMPDPSSMADMDKAVSLIFDAMDAGKSITVFADYDVDGATSASQLIRWARHFGHEFGLYVPDRIKEGYGPNAEAFRQLKEQGTDLVITVDCGAAAHSALEAAQDIELDIIVIDHHLMEGDMPPCAALINPNRPDDGSGLGHLAAAGVTFFVLAALNREARRRDWADAPNVLDFLGLTALGTICDVVPLTDMNRAIVNQGLKVLSKENIIGLNALADVSNITPPFTTYHAGFVIGPRINAGGRIGKSFMGAELLSTENGQTAYGHAAELDRVNTERKKIQDDILIEATEKVMRREDADDYDAVVTSMEGWHPGIIGIVAGRLKDTLNLPSIVIGIDENGIGKGSGRSIRGVNLGEAIVAAKNEGLLLSGGGHAMAGGLSVEVDKIPAFTSFIQDYLREDIKSMASEITLKVDALLHPTGVNRALIDNIAKVGPYGAGNPEPVFALPDLRIAFAKRLRGGHVRCAFEASDGSRLQAICFRADEMGLDQVLFGKEGEKVHVAGRVKLGTWQGRTQIDFHVVDLAAA